MGDEIFKGTFKLDAAKKPKSIDMTVKEGKNYEGKTSLGIYKIEGNRFTWCANEPGRKERPGDFVDSEGDQKFLLVVFERKKEE
jgi:uncharacterized protein (TIGR03067 family)